MARRVRLSNSNGWEFCLISQPTVSEACLSVRALEAGAGYLHAGAFTLTGKAAFYVAPCRDNVELRSAQW
jgi:hypothetical protein